MLDPHSHAAAKSTCGCDYFNSSSVTIGGPGTVELTIGTPETGYVNGVNINQLANEAVLDNGPQSIAGPLTVLSLNIGVW